MSGCDKCWSDAVVEAAYRGGRKVDHYHHLLEERADSPCSPEDQCGELHVVLDWKDGGRRCVCGARVERAKESQP